MEIKIKGGTYIQAGMAANLPTSEVSFLDLARAFSPGAEPPYSIGDYYSSGLYADPSDALGSGVAIPTAGEIGMNAFRGAVKDVSVRNYPPTGLTGENTTVSGQTYGNGVYKVAASSTHPALPIWHAFDSNIATWWHSADIYGYTSGVYAGSNSLVAGYPGEWLRLEMPKRIHLVSYSICPRDTLTQRAPGSFRIYGSNDGTTWTMLDERTVHYSSWTYAYKTFTLPAPTAAFKYFAIAVNKTAWTTGLVNGESIQMSMYYTGFQGEAVPLLDLMTAGAGTGCVGAYSLQRVSSSHTGPVARVRRGSDNAESDFYASANGDLGLMMNGLGVALKTWLGGAAGYLTTWYDQSGQGKNATQGAAGSQPLIDLNTRSLDMRGSKFLALPNGTVPTGNSVYTMAVKHGAVDTSSVQSMFVTSGSLNTNQSNSLCLRTNGTYNHFWWANDYNFGWYVNNDKAGNMVAVRYNGTARQGADDGAMMVSTTVTAGARASTTVNNWIGRGYDWDTRYMNGWLHHVLLFNVALPDCDMMMLTALNNTVLSGCQLWIDFSQRRSYSGSGTTLNDISGNGRNFTLNGAGYTYNAAGFLTLASNTSTYATGPASNAFGFASDITVEFVLQPGTGREQTAFQFQGPSNERMLLAHIPWSTNNVIFDARWAANSQTINRTEYTATNPGNLKHYVMRAQTGTTPSLQIFENGVSKVSNTTYNPSGTWGGQTVLFAGLTGPSTIGAFTSGNMYYIRMYNRALSDAEIAQNAEFAKVKYNISGDLVAHPPAMTAASQTFSNGTYSVSASSTNNANEAAFKAFDGTDATTFWTSITNNYNPAYTGAANTAADGVTLSGEHLTVQLPQAISLHSYYIHTWTSDMARFPSTFYVLGSTNGTTWTIVDSRVEVVSTATSVSGGGMTFYVQSHGSRSKYSYFRLLVNRTSGSSWLSISTWRLFAA